MLGLTLYIFQLFLTAILLRGGNILYSMNAQYRIDQIEVFTAGRLMREVEGSTNVITINPLVHSVEAAGKPNYHTDRTAVIITTHLIPTHPSLEILNQTIESLKFLKGLPSNAQIIITVDGLNEDTQENRKAYHLLRSEVNQAKLQSYIKALKEAYGYRDNVKLLVSKIHQHLGWSLKNAIQFLDQGTEYVYVIQQDLPFVREINHTAIAKTVQEFPDIVNLIRFNNRPNRVLQNSECWNQSEPVQHVNSIHLHKTPQWSDMNYFTPLWFYREHILSTINLDGFPEQTMMNIAWKNCSFYGPHLYGAPLDHAYVKHTDGAERYGYKLKARIARGEVRKEDLRPITIREEKIVMD